VMLTGDAKYRYFYPIRPISTQRIV